MKCELKNDRNVSTTGKHALKRPANLTMLMMMSVLLLCVAPHMIMAEDAAKDNSASTTTSDYGWCVLTCPKTCTPGKEFELKLELRNLKEISRNWEANKLAVHLFWSNNEKWGGYLAHFASAEVSRDGELTLKGKFDLNDKIKAGALYVHVKAVLSSDWGSQDDKKAADLMGPRIIIVKNESAVPKETPVSSK